VESRPIATGARLLVTSPEHLRQKEQHAMEEQRKTTLGEDEIESISGEEIAPDEGDADGTDADDSDSDADDSDSDGTDAA